MALYKHLWVFAQELLYKWLLVICRWTATDTRIWSPNAESPTPYLQLCHRFTRSGLEVLLFIKTLLGSPGAEQAQHTLCPVSSRWHSALLVQSQCP